MIGRVLAYYRIEEKLGEGGIARCTGRKTRNSIAVWH
jgi:hypothetical protein